MSTFTTDLEAQEPITDTINNIESSSTDTIPGHPTVIIFTYLFKSAAILLYLFNSLFTSSYIIAFVIIILLLSADFWYIKNVSGRLLVGLRWWNNVNDDGSNEWIYECKPADRLINTNDSYSFWLCLYITPLVWLILGIGALTSFSVSWLLIVGIAISLNLANVVGYWKCQKDQATNKLKSWATSSIASNLLSRVM